MTTIADDGARECPALTPVDPVITQVAKPNALGSPRTHQYAYQK